jgi:uncharacterized SAM-binding protein YcdF (DUF218 family)
MMIAVVGVLGTVLGYAYWVSHAPTPPEPTGDAVISHAGGSGERLDRALELMGEGAASTLVLLLGSTRSQRAAALCGQAEPYEVLCVDPATDDTIGEARVIAELARSRGWKRLVIVTSDYHLRRALLLDGRCVNEAELLGAASPSERSRLSWSRAVLEEMVAVPIDVLRTC